jgi:hypothetical protein
MAAPKSKSLDVISAVIGSDDAEVKSTARALAEKLTPKDGGDFSRDIIDGVAAGADDAADRVRKTIDALSTKERTEFRSRLRRMPDALREETMTLVNLGLAPYLISKSDREGFLKQLQDENLIVPEEMPALESAEVPADRDVGPQGEVPMEGGVELEYDEGAYGDRRARVADGEEAYDGATYDLGEDFGN